MAFYLVTGGAGFIGSNLVKALLERGERVRVFDNFATGKRANLTEFGNQVEVLEGDLREQAACARAVESVDYVLHQAAL
ncbi:MAG: SDR family NAD(P)-dependent oxidoreductase, partial [candidate division KSB1 bacterium]